MTVYQDIQAAITKGKGIAIEWGLAFITKETLGENNGCGPLQLVVLTKWIGVLEDYICQHFDENGNVITAAYECITQTQALAFVAKINAIEC